jgi:hypothetical protein
LRKVSDIKFDKRLSEDDIDYNLMQIKSINSTDTNKLIKSDLKSMNKEALGGDNDHDIVLHKNN